jgi:hypothetical protein
MGKLHELLAVEGDLEGTYRKIVKETIANFSKHAERYFGGHQRIELFDEGDPSEQDVHKEMDDTVVSKLDYTTGHIVRYLDAVLQKEATNQKASANIVIGDAGTGQIIAENVPATMLLGLEKKLKDIRGVYEAIPTLKPGVLWVLDPKTGENIYKREHDDEKFRTKKVRKNHEVSPATDKHPAQMEVYTEDLKVARIVTTEWSGMISPAEKSAYLARIDNLSRAVKEARQRANRQEVVKTSIGHLLFTYLNKGM